MDLGIAGRWALVRGEQGAGPWLRHGAGRRGRQRGDHGAGAETLRPRPRRSAPRIPAACAACRATSPRRAARRRWRPARRSTSSSTTPAARRRATSATGTARPAEGARRQHAHAHRADQGHGGQDGERGFGRVVNITSGAVKAPIDVLGSNGAQRPHRFRRRPGAPAAPGLANVTINNLLPGWFDTDRIRSTMQAAAAKSGQSVTR